MKQLLFICIALLTVGNVFGQRKADWTAELPNTANEIFFHSLTGVPIVRGDDYYAGIDVVTHAVKWTVKRSGGQALASKIGSDDGSDFFEIAFSPFAVVNHTLVDTRDGKILLDKEKDGYTKILNYEIMPDIESVLFRTFTEGFVRLHLIDKKTGNKRWSSNVFKGGSALSEAFVTTNGNEKPHVDLPIGTTLLTQNNTLMFYGYKKDVAMVNVADGKVLWTQAQNPAQTLFSADEKVAYLVEHDKGGLMAQAMSMGVKRMGKTINAVDVQTGASIWKKPLEAEDRIKWMDLDGKKLMLVHAKGFNFYNMEDGKKQWKDDFEAKRIAKIEENTEGYLVYYGFAKTMQIDKEGKKIWKKAKNAPDFEDADVDEDEDFVTYKYDNGKVVLTNTLLRYYPTKASKMKRFSLPVTPLTKLEYDKERNTLISFDKGGIRLINPDKYPKGFLFKDVKAEVTDIYSVEVRKDNYYFSGPLDFILVKPEGEVIERHYKEPFDGKGFGLGMLAGALAIGGAVYQVSGEVKAMKGAAELTSGTITDDEGQTKSGVKNINKGVKQARTGYAVSEMSSFIPPARVSSFSQTRDFSYFFTKDKATKEKVLVKVSKDSGSELDKLIFNDARPLYTVDDIEDRVLYADKKQLMVFDPKK